MKENPNRTFHIQGIAWSKKNEYVPLSLELSALEDINVRVREEVEGIPAYLKWRIPQRKSVN